MTIQASQAASDSTMTAMSRITNQPPGGVARSPVAVMRTAPLATATIPDDDAVTPSSRPTTSRITDGRRHRPPGSFPSGNTQSRIATKTRNSGHSSSNTTDTQPSGRVPWCIPLRQDVVLVGRTTPREQDAEQQPADGIAWPPGGEQGGHTNRRYPPARHGQRVHQRTTGTRVVRKRVEHHGQREHARHDQADQNPA